MRLIDADALMQSLGITNMDCDKCAWHDNERNLCKRGGDFVDACCAIEDAPTVDAVEVVRCKDCKFFVSDMEWCEADDEHPASPDSFCSWAERRSDE